MNTTAELQRLTSLMQSYCEQNQLEQLEGSTPTAIPDLAFYRAGKASERKPLLYRSGLIIMGQGHKRVYLGEQAFHYGPGDYLALGVPLPLECEAFSEDGKAILGLAINIRPETLQKVVRAISETPDNSARLEAASQHCNLGICSNQMSSDLNAAVIRLLEVLHNSLDAKVLGPAILEEIIYRVLCSKQGHILYDLAQNDSHYAKVAQILDHIHRHYANNLSVESLASQCGMSVSGFHRAFRQVTNQSPLQYLKRVRLDKAKDLILNEGLRANDAAHKVGYSSPSQFSREFKRLFECSPKAITTALVQP